MRRLALLPVFLLLCAALSAQSVTVKDTVMRTYEKLTNEGIIYNKRGIGYLIGAEAKDIVLENNRKEFLEVELPAVIKKMELLGLDPKELLDKSNWVI